MRCEQLSGTRGQPSHPILGASNYTYAEATWTQNLWDWIHAHVRAFEFFGGSSQLVIPDNLKSGVKQPCYYEPELNRTYGDLAIHYGVGILEASALRKSDPLVLARSAPGQEQHS